MKILFIAAVSLSLALPSGAEDLWAKAVQLAGRFKDRVPGRLVVTSAVMDGKGRVQESSELHLAVTPRPDGTLDQDVIKSSKNGEDTTAETRANAARAREGQATEEKPRREKDDSASIGFDNAGVFDPALQDGTRASATGEHRTVDGKTCLGYAFRQKSRNQEEGTLVGTAWLEESTGVPLEVQYASEPLPRHVKELTTTVRYSMTLEGSWEGREMVVEGEGGMLFIKRRFRITMRQEEFFTYEQRAPE